MSSFRYSKRAGGDITALRAQQIADLRERRHQEAYDRVLRRCLEQIREECQLKPATIFIVPSAQSLEVVRRPKRSEGRLTSHRYPIYSTIS